MKEQSRLQVLRRLEKICIGGMAVLCVVLAVCTALLLWGREQALDPASDEAVNGISNEALHGTDEGADASAQTLMDKLVLDPTNIVVGERLPVELFEDEAGQLFSLAACRGSYVVLCYWASWCRYCKEQFQNLDGLDVLLSEQEDVQLYLVDKLDGVKETCESAKTYLQENDLPYACLYDRNLVAYEALGVQIVPTTIILDTQGRVVMYHAGTLSSVAQLEAMIDCARDGRDAATRAFVETQMMNEAGGMYTSYLDAHDTLPSGHDVLSESQGLLMTYAADVGDEALFERAYGYVKENMAQYALPIWVDSEGNPVYTNALLDDLRMLGALTVMNERTGQYDSDIETLTKAIAQYDASKQNPVDFYDFSTKKRAQRLTLCYADFSAMDIVSAQVSGMAQWAQRALTIVENGYIGDAFPFYYNAYSYATKTYEMTSLNMAEAMYTLYHLAQAGRLKEESIAWIRANMGNGIYARYDMDGNVMTGYAYESPSIYALVGLIALEIEDNQLLTQALARMEDFRVFDADSPQNGAIGTQGLESMMSYDQCMALLLYGKIGH